MMMKTKVKNKNSTQAKQWDRQNAFRKNVHLKYSLK